MTPASAASDGSRISEPPPTPPASASVPPARARVVAEWLVLGAVVGVLCGCASALFLWLLDVATATRRAHEAWVWALPVAGLAMGLALERVATKQSGNDLVLDTLHDGGPQLPLRLAPTVLVGSVLTHLFGGSAGREGTAVQMGAGLADWLAHRARASQALRKQLLAAGVAGGFGSVFGTPLAGAVFGLEVVVVGRMRTDALVPALVASFVGDAVTRRLGIEHAAYPTVAPLALDAVVLGKWAVFAGAVALAATLFIELTHALKRAGARLLPRLPVRMMAGGLSVVALWKLVGDDTYLGLGVPTILRAFEAPGLGPHVWALKLLFTSITLGAGFLGGEVTPLFFVGAALGSALAKALGLPIALGAGVGMAAVFAAASNTPLALSCMAVELLGLGALPHVLLVSVAAYVLTGHRGIYPAQRVVSGKGARHGVATRLRDLGEPPDRDVR